MTMKIQRAMGTLTWCAITLSVAPASFVLAAEESEIQEVVVNAGIRGALANSLKQKRDSDNLIEVIKAEDIGKLPDQNLAEVLENITGIQITREAGVGTGVQIRGTNANRTEINGVSTVGSGAGRVGIDFEDVSASIISSIEVTKSPEAKTIEGSVGGTINLKTIRPLDLSKPIAAIRVQGEDSSLSTDGGLMPRLSGTWGDNWSTDAGDFGVVISASYTEQDVTAFRPRADRDNLVASDGGAASAQSFDFLPIQFLNQDYDNFEYETTNFAGSFEWAPNDELTFFFDAVINDQERLQESSRVQASGVSGLAGVSVPDAFQTVNFGSLNGQPIGSIQAALRGVIPVEADGSDPNLRFSSDTGARITESKIFRLGGEWQRDRLTVSAELSTTNSDTDEPNFSTTLNFINPNVATNSTNENGTPFQYDLSGGSLAFGIASGEANAPSVAQLLDPANIMLRDVNIGRDSVENSEDAFRVDFTYDLDFKFITTVDFGYRYNESSSVSDEVRSNTGLRNFIDSPTGDLFADILTAGPNNFGSADGRGLFVRDFLLINPELVASNPSSVLATINAAIVANNAITGSTRGPISDATSAQDAFFDIEEDTSALYAQANFEHGIFRGNVGFRYVDTDISSKGNTVLNGVATPTTTGSSYDFFLPRFNLVADVTEDVLIRGGWSKDIRRPDFNDLSTSFSFETSPNASAEIGNPALVPEEVTSFDISAEWYFAPSSVVSIGYFNKKRKDLHVDLVENPFEDAITGFRDLTAPCEGGGLFNPIADVNVFGPPATPPGVCVPTERKVNDTGETTQKGIEIAVQYDLSQFESDLGWASGFGVIANYTWQEFSGGDFNNTPTSRAENVFSSLGADNVTFQQPLLDNSENAYNITLYYEKYNLSARTRYTWREAYRSDDYGSTSSDPWGFPVVQEDRGQLNASVNYAVNDKLDIGIEAVNITKSDVEQSCVNEGGLLCFQGLTDRRVTLGVSYKFL